MMPLRIKMWMWIDAPNEDSQSRSSDEAELYQSNDINQLIQSKRTHREAWSQTSR